MFAGALEGLAASMTAWGAGARVLPWNTISFPDLVALSANAVPVRVVAVTKKVIITEVTNSENRRSDILPRESLFLSSHISV